MRIALMLGLLWVPCVAWGGEEAPLLTEDRYAAVRDRILPTAEEVAWRQIPWRESFWEGVIEAQETRRPILLWAMNGHPLGCT